MSERLAKKVLLIGWDAADWKVIHPLLDKGQMPALEKLINGGVMGNLATLDPPMSPMLWTSIATGMTADKHGILGFVEPEPNSAGIRPVSVTSRKVKAIWNILTQKGFKTHTVGWWPSHPAEPINGICVSNEFAAAKGPINSEWPLPKGTIYPETFSETLSQLRIHPEEITHAHILPFLPLAATIDQTQDKGIQVISRILSECSSYHAAATWIMENNDWDFMAVYFDAVDHFCHSFMKFHPPQQNGIPDAEFEKYKDVINGAYRFHDMMLERLMQLAGDDTTIILLSDHGFYSDHMRPQKLPSYPAAPALEHSPYGIICMNGTHIKKDEHIYGASLLDITPTILTIFGLPVGNDMDGKALVSAFDKEISPEIIPSWENVPGESGMHPESMRENTFETQAGLDQLIELGYIEAPSDNTQQLQKSVISESRFYLARVFMHSRKYNEALSILEDLFEKDKDKTRYGLRLATCYQLLNRVEDCRKTIDILRTANKELPQLDLLEGTLLLGENRPRKALEFLHKAEQSVSHLPNLHLQLGSVFLQMHNWKDAERAFNSALLIDQDNAQAHYGLAICFLKQDKYEEAIEEALNATGLLYNFPPAHYTLGEALAKADAYEQAAQAFEVTIKFSPGIKKAHQWLAKIYEEHLNNPDKAAIHKKFIKENIKGTITIVTGLPRSGTSMMMQMLNFGGVEILTDGVRENDINNPKGYYEYEKVKRLHIDNKWLNEAEGKCVKIVAPLLQFLPTNFHYKIIFMHRDMNEVLRSQQIMLGKEKDVKNNTFPLMLSEAFKKQLEKANTWIKSMPELSVIHINHHDVINNPIEEAENISSFLSLDLDITAMTSAVDKELHRNKSQKVL